MKRYILRDILIIVGLTALLMAAGSVFGDSIRLHDQVGVAGTEVLLRDVAELEGKQVEHLGEIVLAIFNPNQQQLTVDLDEVRHTLSDDGRVNWAMVTLKGYRYCRVDRIHEVPKPDDVEAKFSPPIVNVETNIDLSSSVTIRDRLIEQIELLAGTSRKNLQITFVSRDEALLNSSAWEDKIVFEPLSKSPLGRIPMKVHRYHNNELIETHRVTVEVARRITAVVTTQSVGRGQTFAPSDVTMLEVYLSRDLGMPVTDVSKVVGQTASAMLRKGAIIYPGNVSAPLLVRRGQIITVRCMYGHVEVKTIARAESDGAAGQVISVRNEHSRQRYPVKVTALRQAVAVMSRGEGASP